MENILQLKAGKVPLVGHGLKCMLDKEIFKYNYVFGGTGDYYHTLKINPFDLEKVNNTIAKF